MKKNKEELKNEIKLKLEKKAEELIESMDCSDEKFTIDTIESIMTRFNIESKQIAIDAVNEVIVSFDERSIIAKKNRRSKV
jgi:hypothetical protein